MLMAMYPSILGDPGASSQYDAIFSGEKLQQERETFTRKMSLAGKYFIVSTSSLRLSEDGTHQTCSVLRTFVGVVRELDPSERQKSSVPNRLHSLVLRRGCTRKPYFGWVLCF